MHYYSFHIGDYRAATAHLSNDEDLAFRRLLDMYYDTEEPIPLDTQWVARRLRVDIDTLVTVLNDMFVHTENGWTHSRCDAEIAHYHELAQRNRENGKKGGRPKKPSGLPVESQTEPKETLTSNQEPITNNHKPKREQQRGSRLPDKIKNIQDWVNFCQTERPDLVFDKVYSQFRDYWIAQPGQKGVKLDWEATWRNWVRRQSAPKQSFAQQAADIARVTVPGSTDPDPALLKIKQDREKAAPMPAHIRQQINQVLRKV